MGYAVAVEKLTLCYGAVKVIDSANFEVEPWGLGACAVWYSALLLTRAWICYNSHTKQNELGW